MIPAFVPVLDAEGKPVVRKPKKDEPFLGPCGFMTASYDYEYHEYPIYRRIDAAILTELVAALREAECWMTAESAVVLLGRTFENPALDKARSALAAWEQPDAPQ